MSQLIHKYQRLASESRLKVALLSRNNDFALNDSLLKGSCSRVPLAVFHGQIVLQVQGSSLPTLDTVTTWKTVLNVYSVHQYNCMQLLRTHKSWLSSSTLIDQQERWSTQPGNTWSSPCCIAKLPATRWGLANLWSLAIPNLHHKKLLQFWLRQVPRFVSKANFGSDATFCKYSST